MLTAEKHEYVARLAAILWAFLVGGMMVGLYNCGVLRIDYGVGLNHMGLSMSKHSAIELV